MKKLIPLLLLFEIVSISPSCNKNDAPVTPDIIDSVKIMGLDSSQLVKSITTKGIDRSGNYLDSETFYIYYDTLNKRAIFSSIFIPAQQIIQITFLNRLMITSGGLFSKK